MDFIPDKSEIQVENIDMRNDRVLKAMVKDLKLRDLIPGARNAGKGGRRQRQE